MLTTALPAMDRMTMRELSLRTVRGATVIGSVGSDAEPDRNASLDSGVLRKHEVVARLESADVRHDDAADLLRAQPTVARWLGGFCCRAWRLRFRLR
jgi:hypothetical protein